LRYRFSSISLIVVDIVLIDYNSYQ
jgi:hypothetical protein